MYYKTSYTAPIGSLTLVSDGQNLVSILFERSARPSPILQNDLILQDGLPVFDLTRNWLDRYFSRQRPKTSELPLLFTGSEFQQTVWQILQTIPYGEVMSYGEIAKTVAQKFGKVRMSAQAVGGAVGHNPIPIVIPCHRVVGANGSLTGYGGGIMTKVRLLELEGTDLSNMFLPKKN
ncbi:MAG: methylated-DNA--[protein]-cysteine S-methyltransferase [Bifidobacteriaceae bacterium]|jgi:methylated-DNA-[protein]-cysteine S-methyltransferase|nr:methylated-DNA--[protein]-cysteine S-methyltransferase [Bifidobacteriaceae bacterium]